MKGNLPRKKTEYCKWVSDFDMDCENSFDTNCGHTFIIINGTPAENNMKYCPYCGKVIK